MLKHMIGKFIYIYIYFFFIFYSHLERFCGLGFQTLLKFSMPHKIKVQTTLTAVILKRKNFNVKQVLMGFGVIVRSWS
jgi:hypothetical protein